MVFIAILLLAVCIVEIIAFAVLCLSAGYMGECLKEENQRLQHMLKKSYLMERDYLKACEEMFREAGCSGGFQEDSRWKGDDEEN